MKLTSKSEIDYQFEKRRREVRQCQDDSCEMGHCSKCGCHIAQQWRNVTGTHCDTCELITEQYGNR